MKKFKLSRAAIEAEASNMSNRVEELIMDAEFEDRTRSDFFYMGFVKGAMYAKKMMKKKC